LGNGGSAVDNTPLTSALRAENEGETGTAAAQVTWDHRLVPEERLPQPRRWLAPEELVAIGCERSRVVMMNEAHHMLLRSIRTREVGRRILPTAHEAGVRNLAMEALSEEVATRANATRTLDAVEGGYLAQPDMRELVETALELGWRLIAYEAHPLPPPDLEPRSTEASNWREEQQARNLVAALDALAGDERMLVWCGNEHLAKCSLPASEWRPMGVRFTELSGVEPFAINQIRSVEFPGQVPPAGLWVDAYSYVLAAHGGAAGFLAEEAPAGWGLPNSADAFLLATDNRMS
jgi:hypothetical protein